jgi:hypothetical protein
LSFNISFNVTRFEGSIGGEQQQAAAAEGSSDRTYERPRFEVFQLSLLILDSLEDSQVAGQNKSDVKSLKKQLLSTNVNFFQPEDEFADEFDEFDDEHAYDSPTEEPKPAPMDEDSEYYQKPRSPPCEMSNYDTPHSTLESHSGRDMASSLEFTVGTQFESAVTGPPLNTPSYNNPLASVPTVGNLPTLYDTPGATGNENI